jgi:uncharacterized cupredoxin-like copper-binding protein
MPINEGEFMRTKRFLAVVTAGVLFAACGGGDREANGGQAGADSGESESMDGMHHGAGSDAIDFGQPARPSDADRTIEVTAFDSFKFKPVEINVKQGETITFAVSNIGVTVHEFTLGDEDFQSAHEEEMSAEQGMDMDTETSISIDPGETERLTWSFTEAGDVLYGCHEPGHYEAGMVGTIDVK